MQSSRSTTIFMAEATNPGGPRVSSAKKRRLAALEQRVSSASQLSQAAVVSAAPAAYVKPKKRSKHTVSSPEPDRLAAVAAEAAVPSGTAAAPAAAPSCLQQETTKGSAAYGPAQPGTRHAAGAPPADETAADTEPPYDKLSPHLLEGPVAAIFQFPSSAPAGGNVVHQLLEQLMKSNPRIVDARSAYTLKLQDKTLLLDNPTATISAKGKAGPTKEYASQLAGAAAQRRLGLYRLPNEQRRYALFEPVHQLWQRYITNIVMGCQNVEERLLCADLHGCCIEVIRSKNPAWVGIDGIIVKDTSKAFHIITRKDKLHFVAKAGSLFQFRLDSKRVCTLQGGKLTSASK